MEKYTQQFEKLVDFCTKESINHFGMFFPGAKIVSIYGEESYYKFIKNLRVKYDVDYNNEWVFFLGKNQLNNQ